MPQELHDKLQPVFDQFDVDGSDTVSISELTSCAETLQLGLSADELKTMLEEADVDNSGEIDYDEFVAVIQKHIARGKGGGFASIGKLMNDPEAMQVVLRNTREEVEAIDLQFHLRGKKMEPPARQELKAVAAAHGLSKFTLMPLIVKATSLALAEYPTLNSSVSDDGTELIVKAAHNIGVAMDTPTGEIGAVACGESGEVGGGGCPGRGLRGRV